MSTTEEKETVEVPKEQEETIADVGSSKRKRDEEEEPAEDSAAQAQNGSADASKKAKVEEEDKETAKEVNGNGSSPAPAAAPSATPAEIPAAAPAQSQAPSGPSAPGVTQLSMTSTGNGQELLVLEIEPDKVGSIIGSKGLIIKEIQDRSGAKAFVNQDFPPGVNRQVNITGTATQVKTAAELINMILTQGPTSIHANNLAGGPQVTQVIECSQPQVGKIIGTGGATIKELQSKSGARIQIDQNYPPDVPRKISVTGTAAAVALGIQLIQNIMAGGNALMNMGMPGGGGGMGVYGPGGGMGGGMGGMGGMGMGGMQGMGGMGMPAGQMQMTGNEARQMIEVPKSIVGKIIGRGGENIGMIQRKSGARAMLDQAVPEGMPCKVNVTGTPQAVTACIQIIQEVMMGVPVERAGANLPMGGGGGMGGAGGAPYGGMGGGAYGGMGMGGMGGGVQGMGGMGMGGGMPGMGMPQGGMGMQQQYGGYGGYGQNPAMGGMGNAYGGAGMAGMGGAAGGGYQAYGAAGGGGMGGYPGMQQNYGAGGMAGGMGGAANGMAGGAGAGAGNKAGGAAASPWSEHKTDDGVTYWYNSVTGVSQWERPKM